MFYTVVITATFFGIFLLIFFRKRMNIRRLNQLYDEGAQLIDVRSVKEFSNGSIEGAINIPHDEIVSSLKELDKANNYITFCSQGVRSVIAKKILQKQGYSSFNGGAIGSLKQKLKSN